MTLTPRSLFGRNVLLIVSLIVLAQIGSALLVRELILRPRLDLIAEGLARNIAAIRAGLVALPLAQRTSFVDEFNRRGLLGVREAAPETARQASLTLLERRFVRTISQRIAAEGTEIVWRREAGGSFALRLGVPIGVSALTWAVEGTRIEEFTKDFAVIGRQFQVFGGDFDLLSEPAPVA